MNYKPLCVVDITFLPYLYLWSFCITSDDVQNWNENRIQKACSSLYQKSWLWTESCYLVMNNTWRSEAFVLYLNSCSHQLVKHAFCSKEVVLLWLSVSHAHICSPSWVTNCDFFLLLFFFLADQGGEKKRKKGASFQTVSSLHKVCCVITSPDSCSWDNAFEEGY